MATSFEVGGEPCIHNCQSFFFGDGAFADGEDIGVIVFAIPNGDLLVPAKTASNARYAVGCDRFSISGSAEDDSAVELSIRYGFGHRSDIVRVVTGFGGVGAVVFDGESLSREMRDNCLFVMVACMIGTNGDGEFAHSRIV